MMYDNLFWLHIKKSGGTTARNLLKPYYVEVDRSKKPKNFIQASPEEYNDIINNYRVVLGEYQLKRCLFAKKYLYKEQWNKTFSFAFSREPIDRCLSMFYYLYFKDLKSNKDLLSRFKTALFKGIGKHNISYAFDIFLDHIVEAQSGDSYYSPLGNHFTTHTAPMWGDVTDFNGNILLTNVFRLENLVDGINRAFEQCGISKKVQEQNIFLNRKVRKKVYYPSQCQIKKYKVFIFKILRYMKRQIDLNRFIF